ncbi:MAG: alpha-glucan family phosphorylase [Planctomycetaceae bacterium]
MRTATRQLQPGFLYVVSWEVCNRQGGICTVLETSAPHLRGAYGDELLYVGPDLWADRAAQSAFIEEPLHPEVAALAAERDVPVRFGRWAMDGHPPCALVDFGRLLEKKNELLGDLWKAHGVDSIHADWDAVENILFGHAAGKLIELHYRAVVRPRARRAVAHFHHWMSAAGVLRLADTTPEIGTVYTSHGTALGRKLANEGLALHLDLPHLDPATAAKERRIEALHTLEVATAKEVSVLACVSEHGVEEAVRILGRRPDLVTPNGYAAPPRTEPQHRNEVRAALLRCAERFLGGPVDGTRTRLLFSSGRYEFHNKGFDLLIKASGLLAKRTEPPPRPLLILICMAAAQTGLRLEVLKRMKENDLAGSACGVCTHNLAHPESDPILAACREAGLDNRPGDPVRILFAPIMLDGRDALLPYSYSDVLQASDLSAYPSLYEPWGYTPLESLAAGVPTITTDLTGFGRFVLSLPEKERAAVTVLPARGSDNGALVAALEQELARFLARSDEEMEALRRGGDAVVKRTSWDRLIAKTREAHEMALQRAAKRRGGGTMVQPARLSHRSVIVIPTRGELRPNLHRFTVSVALPERIERLAELSLNLWWSWDPPATALFQRLAREVPQSRATAPLNPVALLRMLDPQTLAIASRDDAFLEAYDRALARFDAYKEEPGAAQPTTAYLCAEFALHETLPIYSGGLGVLAGDHLKSASDLKLPLVGVGLRYANGYFRQRIRSDGRQAAEFLPIDPRETPLVEVADAAGAPLRISIPMPERELKAGVWRVDVGRVPLYLLDTLVPENDPADRAVTDRLYPSDREPRIRQEILLGVGGWRLLKALGKTPDVCHLNEGHSSFVQLERLADLIEREGLTFAEAAQVIRASTAFTTHTPVPAGHDRFSEDLIRRYFGHTATRLGLDWTEFLNLGRSTPESREFSMTILALRLSGRANGVSRLHGSVSRKMNADVWPGFHEAEVPIDSITNGVHLATWAGPEIGALIEKHVAADWTMLNPDKMSWARAEAIGDKELAEARAAQKRRLLRYLRASIEETGLRRGERPVELARRLEGIDESALWIGYARRFAPYKRAMLLFRNPARLQAILDHPDRPVRLVFSGKSHPDDGEGAELVRQVVELTQDPRFAGRVFFVEDYAMAAARLLVQGADVWLNTPTRPLEASGTSGMKACLNGAPHLSILDGWWCEAYDGENGWAIGDAREHPNPEMQNEHDSRALYGLLETEVAPLFFERGSDGLPSGWLQRARRALQTVPAHFNTHRMVGEYLRSCYEPLARERARLVEPAYEGARALAARHRRLREAWSRVEIAEVSVTDLTRGSIGLGEVFEARAQVRLGTLKPDEVAVELYIGPVGQDGVLRDPVVITLMRDGEPKDGVALFHGAYLPRGAGTFRYGVRVLPATDSFHEAAAVGLVRWA